MQFQRLRLSGFKSFVEPTEFRIEPGLTGVVGPNGCGKSNVLEALRWVMGASSAKAMRAAGMDDVIFAGSGSRPSRNHAEVTLTIDNADRTAPSQFNDHAVLEVTRRIDRGDGSSYRVNGREVRARDVQLLFADASTGANSPALVRQGQISELISAKPQNRRLILEEAAGISGLHTRRHEAELRLRGAETNLTRLDDVAGELDGALSRLRREARQAEKYKRLAAEVRMVQSAALHARWTEAKAAAERLTEEAAEAGRAVAASASAAAEASAGALKTGEAIKPLREEEMVAAAVLHRLAIEKDRLERQAQQAKADLERLSGEVRRIAANREHEAQVVGEAKAALERLAGEIEIVKAQITLAPERLPQLEAAWTAAEESRAASEGEVERLAAQAAADEARRSALAQRIQEAEGRAARTQRALATARADRDALGPAESPQAAEATARFAAALEALRKAREAAEAAEADQAKAATDEAAARDAARKLDDQIGRLKAEARGLAQLAAPQGKAGFSRALDEISPERGLEAALAAALGDDLDAALDPRAPAFWGGREAAAPVWPKGVLPLAAAAPAALAARLAYVGVAARADGDRLAAQLQPGMRLVSKEGDLWRWDGFVSRASAPRPAAVRLAQKARLSELEAEIDSAAPQAASAALAARQTADRLKGAEDALKLARRAPQEAERALAQAREAVDGFAREAARTEARAQSLSETIARFEAELVEAEAGVSAARGEADGLPLQADLAPALASARQAAAACREAAAAARSALDMERREREGRAQRLSGLERDHGEWSKRLSAAARRIEALAADIVATDAALASARDAPAAIDALTVKLIGEYETAEARRNAAGDALAAAEGALEIADRASRAADAAAGSAREAKAALEGRLEGARERLEETTLAIRTQVQIEPEALGRRLTDEASALPSDPARVEAHLKTLEQQLDAIGAVNLRAEEEAAEYEQRLSTLRAERADLSGAVSRLRAGIEELNAEGRERLLAAFEVINGHFQALFQALFGGGQAELRLIESDDPLEAGLEIYACPPGKRLSAMSLMSGGEQALTAAALIFGVFLANPAPICVLDEVDAPLDDANVDRFCNMLDEMRTRTQTRFIAITHNPVTMARMDRLFGVTMHERGVSQLVSVDLTQAELMVAQ